MSDIANELRERSLRAEQEGEPLALLDEAADEIERLRAIADRRGDLAVERRREIERLRLTDEEREVIEYLLLGGCEGPDDEEEAMREKVRAFVQRTK
jgi:hypothetical protein